MRCAMGTLGNLIVMNAKTVTQTQDGGDGY
jgi:hypothetical protein